MGAVRHTASLCAQELEQELEPKDAELRLLGDQLAEQDAELVEELKRSSVRGSNASRVACGWAVQQRASCAATGLSLAV